jgi:hypothetical protein
VWSPRASGERVSGRRAGTNISRIFGGISIFWRPKEASFGILFIFGSLRKLFSATQKWQKNNMLFLTAIKNP